MGQAEMEHVQRTLLQIRERYLQGSRNREHSNVAKLVRRHIKEHLAMLQDLQKEIRG